MRKYLTLFTGIAGSFILLFGLVSCEGPAGPPGPPGFDGADGADGLIGTVFEAEVDFNPSNDYSGFVEFPGNVEVFESDVVVAYILTAVEDGTDIWEPLPQTLFFGPDILLYGYDHTVFDIRFFLDGTVVFANLDPVFTDGIIFRIAIIPAAFAEDLDVNNLEDVMNALNVDQVERINRDF
jgi:hypothetical protein